MPIYQYRCDECSCETEELREIEDRELPVVCQYGHPMRRLISLCSFTTPITNRQKVADCLNQPGGYGVPGKDKHTFDALAKGLGQHSTHPGQYRPIGKNAKAFY